MTSKPNKFNNEHNPLVVLFKILTNALLDDKHGVNTTAYNALLILAGTVDADLAKEIEKKAAKRSGRHRYEN